MVDNVATAQSTRLTIRSAVKRFKQLIDDDELVGDGQFIWLTRYRDQLLDPLTDSLIDASPGLFALWKTRDRDTGRSLLQDARAAMVQRDSKALDIVIATALAAPVTRDGSPTSNAFLPLLTRSGQGGEDAYDEASRLLSQGKRVVRTSAEFQQAFAQRRLSFRGAVSISKVAQERCFAMTNAVCSYIAKKGGLAKKPVRGVKDPGQVFDQGARAGFRLGVTKFQGPIFELVRYGASLEAQVRQATRVLDAGHLLNAQVVPGVKLDNPSIISPEHSLPIIAWERRDDQFPRTVFGFWDPDAAVTNAPGLEQGFGLLFFEDGKVARDRVLEGPHVGLAPDGAGDPYSPDFYKNGRLTTALFDVDLGVNDGGRDRKNLKRYQVTAMGARPGGG